MTNIELEKCFPIGCRVRLKVAPVGEPGTVILHRRNKVIVEWHDLDNAVFGYKSDALVLVEVAKEPL